LQTPDAAPTRAIDRPETVKRRSPAARKTAKPKRETFTIGFRVDAYTLAQLEKGAAGYGISVHEYARQRLLELLEKQEEARLLDAVTGTQREVRAMREQARAYIKEATVLLLANLLRDDELEAGTIRREVDMALDKAES